MQCSAGAMHVGCILTKTVPLPGQLISCIPANYKSMQIVVKVEGYQCIHLKA